VPWIAHTNPNDMPVFNDSENMVPLVPEGDYIFCVVGFEIGISNGAKTRGSERYEVELELEGDGHGKKINEGLIDHESTGWKLDCFLKSAGVNLVKGKAYDFREDLAKSNNVPWVNPLGLRGWCRVIQDTLPPRTEEDAKAIKAGTKKATVLNKVAVFYTDRPKLPARVMEVPEEERPF
jgi:hypothetical protein